LLRDDVAEDAVTLKDTEVVVDGLDDVRAAVGAYVDDDVLGRDVLTGKLDGHDPGGLREHRRRRRRRWRGTRCRDRGEQSYGSQAQRPRERAKENS
jgi:hypothetical protein